MQIYGRYATTHLVPVFHDASCNANRSAGITKMRVQGGNSIFNL